MRHLIYVSAAGDFVSPDGVRTVFWDCSAEHVLVKSTLETKLLHGAFGWKTTVLGPTLFFSNDLRSQASMLREGVFGEPLGERGVSRVATADVALAATNLILDPERKHAGTKVMLRSLKTFSKAQTAALWSKALGREVRMLGSDEEGLQRLEEEFVKVGVERDWARDIRLMYETFAGREFGMGREEWEVQCEVLGKEPEGYEEWVAKTGREWLEEGERV